mgnify:CR=1 FL=1
MAVTAEILLGQGHRRLHRLADEHVLRLRIRVSREHGTFGGDAAHRQVKYIQFRAIYGDGAVVLNLFEVREHFRLCEKSAEREN